MDGVTAFVSVLPGRIRLRHPALRERARHAELTTRLQKLVQVESNPTLGSLLLRFAPGDDDVVALIRAEVAAVLPAALADAPRPRPHMGQRIALARPRKAKWEINRAAKIGAMVSMAVSLAALGSSKKLHAQAGMVFVAMMLVHMAVHWRRTLK